jgi:hypothetical protein
VKKLSIFEKRIIIERKGSEPIKLTIDIGLEPTAPAELSLEKTKELIELLKNAVSKEYERYHQELKF